MYYEIAQNVQLIKGGFKMTDLEDMGKRLISLRNEKSLEVVANAIGTSVSALKKYEQGVRIPRDEIKVRLSKYYKTSIDKIF